MKNKKPSAWQAWKMLLLSLPKGIAAFVTIVVGLSISLPLSVFLIGLPLLAETLLLGRRMMEAESCTVNQWQNSGGNTASGETASSRIQPREWQGWRHLLAVLGQGRSYRSILYGLFQLPVGIAAFTLAIVLPVTSWAVMLSPLAQQVSMRLYSFDLFSYNEFLSIVYPNGSSYAYSWIAAGVGAILVLIMPAILRAIGRMYAAWVRMAAGPEEVPVVSETVETNGPAAAIAAAERLPESRQYA